MDEEIKPRRERRRRRLEKKIYNRNEIQMTLENAEQPTTSYVSQSSAQLSRRDTFTVMKSKSNLDFTSDGEQFDCKNTEGSENDNYELKSSTYIVNKTSEESMHETYNLENLQNTRDANEFRPVPEPRKRKSNVGDGEKFSSDTDRDVTEIDLDDFRPKTEQKSPESDVKSQNSANIIFPPVPKPRTTVRTVYKASDYENSKTEQSNPAESLTEKTLNSDSNVQLATNELPLIENLVEETKDSKESAKKNKFVSDFFIEKKRKRKARSLVSMMKLERKKIPRISAVLKELKDDEKETKTEDVEDKFDFQIDSPHYPETVHNGQIYVQSKHGFYLMERDEVFKNENAKVENEGNGGRMEDSTVKTAILFQSYWSRSMIYFHGILAGFAFGHAATVTAIMMHYNYEPKPFIGVYSCLSLKVHYVFYALTTLCIVSCFDRLDIGHMNKKHLQIAWKAPSMWMILCFYMVSFGLSFSNQTAEARFDAFSQVNLTKVWWDNDEQVSLLQWYYTAWARDILVLCAWLLISLTEFQDFLNVHLNNMVRYADVKGEGINLHRLSRQKTENS